MIGNPDADPRRRKWRAEEKWLAVALVATGIASLLPEVAPEWWVSDLCSHFHVQWLFLSALAAGFCALRRNLLLFSLAAAFIVINAVAIAPVLRPASSLQALRPDTRVVFANIYYLNENTDEVINFVRASHADIVVLAEVTPLWNTHLKPLERDYPYQHFSYLAGERRTGLLLLSRWPLEGQTTLGFGRTGDPGLMATVRTGSRVLHIVGVHPTWPLWRLSTGYRNAQFTRIAKIARSQGASTIVVGDFNATAFSPAFQRFVSASGLSSAARGRGWFPTWPTFFPPLYLQIDHALVSPDLKVAGFARGPRIGSDHLPIIVDLARE